MTSLALACRLGAVTAPRSIPRRVRAILNKYDATMLLPGVSGVLRFGYQPGNYRESTGQTLAAADKQVGLVVDAARVPGVELVANGGFDTDVGGWVNNGSGSFIWSSGSGRFTRSSSTDFASLAVPTIADRTYAVTFAATCVLGSNARVAAGPVNSITSGSNSLNNSFIGAGSIVFRATGTTSYVCLGADANGTVIDYDNISVRELPGIHASQSTSGFQPVVRNTAGIQSWQFDGTDDRLSLSAVPFQMSDDPFCIVAFECGALGANRSVIDLATSASSARFANLRINAIGQPQSVVVNDAVSATLITAKEVSAGTKLVLAATTVEGVQKLYVEGAYAAEAVLSGTFTSTESYIGSRKGASENFNGHIHCVIFGKGAISGAELLTLEKFAASLQGRNL